MRIKKCTKCGEVKDFRNFYKNKRTKNGISCWCKECHKSLNQTLERKRKQNDYSKTWYAKPGSKAYMKKYMKEYINKPEIKIRRSIYNAKRKSKKNNSGGSYTLEQWQNLCNQNNNKCLCCGKVKKLTVDHVLPISKGGSSDISNIQPLCISCNSSKRSKMVDYRILVPLSNKKPPS